MRNLDNSQYGCLKGTSTVHYLTDPLHLFYENSDKPNTIGSLLLTDLAKAFDNVDHSVAINCLISLGARPEIIPWIISFLTERRQRVRYHSAFSNWVTLTCGVPQGTKIGPLVFLAIIDKACSDFDHKWKFVDDLSLGETYDVGEDSILQDEIIKLNDWCQVNKLLLNPTKCKTMHFCLKKTCQTFLQWSFVIYCT